MGCNCKICGENNFKTLVEGKNSNYVKCKIFGCDSVYVQDKDTKNVEFTTPAECFAAYLKYNLGQNIDFDKAVNNAYRDTINGCVEFRAVKNAASIVVDENTFFNLLENYHEIESLKTEIKTIIEEAKEKINEEKNDLNKK